MCLTQEFGYYMERKMLSWDCTFFLLEMFSWFYEKNFLSYQTCLNRLNNIIDTSEIHFIGEIDFKKWCNINKIFCKVNKSGKPKPLFHSKNEVWFGKQKFSSLNWNIISYIFWT